MDKIGEIHITFKVTRREGYYSITSDDVRGLHLGGATFEIAVSDLAQVLPVLLRSNHSIEF